MGNLKRTIYRPVDQSIYGFPSCLSHEAFPRGFPTGLSHVHTWWDSILDLNVKANREIEAITDQDHWGVVDRWDIPTDGKGDCEDYVLLKRQRLAEAGLPRRAMRVTVVIDEENAGHAVLMIRTDRGDFILDNKRNAILPWSQTGYTYVKRESQARTGWASLGGLSTSTVASLR